MQKYRVVYTCGTARKQFTTTAINATNARNLFWASLQIDKHDETAVWFQLGGKKMKFTGDMRHRQAAENYIRYKTEIVSAAPFTQLDDLIEDLGTVFGRGGLF